MVGILFTLVVISRFNQITVRGKLSMPDVLSAHSFHEFQFSCKCFFKCILPATFPLQTSNMASKKIAKMYNRIKSKYLPTHTISDNR